jgi:hypothetical protein
MPLGGCRLYSPRIREGVFSELRMQDLAQPRSTARRAQEEDDEGAERVSRWSRRLEG